MTDARGVISTLNYRWDHQVTAVTYNTASAPGVAATPNVTIAYDAAGNRIGMTDGLGSTSYTYDRLSRLTSETRTFTGVVTYTLSYGYNLSGAVTYFINQSGARVDYQRDKLGRVTGVAGAGYAGVSSYINPNGIQYRAFGGIKTLHYGNGKTLSVLYDNRMRMTRWDVANVIGSVYSYTSPNIDERTGRVTFADNLYDERLDRSYSYDQVGRLRYSYTSSEGRAHAGVGVFSGQYDGPYAHEYQYDEWGNLTSRAGWGGWNASYTASYTNNRRDGHTYDAAGNITSDGGQVWTYDAANKQVTSSWDGLQQGYDGDGLRGKKVQGGQTLYYLRSSVFANQVVSEISGGGIWTRGYVYLGGQLLALQQDSSVQWAHQDPVTKGQKLTTSGGTVRSSFELDPWGGETTWWESGEWQPHRFTTYERDSVGGMDEAQARRYHGWWSRFSQPDPYEGSYNLSDPQKFNRYSYVQKFAGRDPQTIITAEGERVRGYGRVELYVGGRLFYTLMVRRNADFAVGSCSYEGEDPCTHEREKKLYPCLDRNLRRR